jgi:hypothetical protein
MNETEFIHEEGRCGATKMAMLSRAFLTAALLFSSLREYPHTCELASLTARRLRRGRLGSHPLMVDF